MDRQKIIAACNASIEDNGYIDLSDDILASLSDADIADIVQTFGTHYLMRLPAKEVQFFEWLKEHDRSVWDDLWGVAQPEPYLISLAFLDRLAGSRVGGDFVICDLQTQDNYYFSPLLFREKESWDYMAAVRERFRDHQSLTLAQALALEASAGEVDIWHFAYRNNVPIDSAKKAVRDLVDDRILLHVANADHLTEYFDVR